MASAFLNSIKGSFSPSKKGETLRTARKGKVGSLKTPTRKSHDGKLFFGKRR